MKKVFYPDGCTAWLSSQSKWLTELEFPVDAPNWWNTHHFIEFSRKQAMELRQAAKEIHQMCMQSIDDMVSTGDYENFHFSPAILHDIESSWRREDQHCYGRMDFSYDGNSCPKLLEYNGDTPVNLVESARLQKSCLVDQFGNMFADFNEIEPLLVKHWHKWLPQAEKIYFTSVQAEKEETANTRYMAMLASQAGINARYIALDEINWNEDLRMLVDEEEVAIESLFKMYAWDFMIEEPIYQDLRNTSLNLIEPMWKLLLSSKEILVHLWQRYPGHPNLLPAFFAEEDIKQVTDYFVKKPFLSRQGENISIFSNSELIHETSGLYSTHGHIYQQRHDLPRLEGAYQLSTIWVVGDEVAGLGMREDTHLITGVNNCFVPHYVRD